MTLQDSASPASAAVLPDATPAAWLPHRNRYVENGGKFQDIPRYVLHLEGPFSGCRGLLSSHVFSAQVHGVLALDAQALLDSNANEDEDALKPLGTD